MYPITHKRILAPYVLSAKGIAKLSTTTVDGNHVIIKPFSDETYSTCYIPTPVAILNGTSLDEFLLDDLSHLMQLYQTSPEAALPQIHTLLSTAGLYHTSSSTPPLLLALTNV